ncbi:MAG: SGNH/GDSL hydrolase family protein [Lachnospiraceae bacterium]|nr:SGNH/GDSL hydrolase family protein [Lachnospiraceae bacterium]
MKMGPIAPQDPVRQRQFYYVMLDKQVSIFPTPSGKNASIIFANDGRLRSASELVGNVTDKKMLDLVDTTKGIKELVYGIGVSMITDTGEGAKFFFEQITKENSGGTTISCDVTGDGVEYLLPFDAFEWRDDDNTPGQFRFEFENLDVIASVNVRFYLNDGYTAPPFEGIDKVDPSSEGYKEMICNGVLSLGDTSRLKEVFKRARAGENVAITFIGGSITQGAGSNPINKECYAYKTYEGFKKIANPKGEVSYVKAGVGGTPSELGMIRVDKDLIKFGEVEPDVVVIEFAVNDAGDETGGDCFEGLVRRCLNMKKKPAVILLFSVFVDDYNLEERLVPIGEYYDLPMVSIKKAVTKQFYLKKDEGRVIGKNAFFYDRYHPANIGHTIMADCLINLFEIADKEDASVSDKSDGSRKALRSSDFDEIHLIDRTHNAYGAVIEMGSFSDTDENLQACQMDESIESTPQFPDNWRRNGKGSEPFRMKIKCKTLLIVYKDSNSKDEGDVDVYVDGKFVRKIDPRAIGWVHCNPFVIIREKEVEEHVVEIKMSEGFTDKNFTILGFGAAVR